MTIKDTDVGSRFCDAIVVDAVFGTIPLPAGNLAMRGYVGKLQTARFAEQAGKEGKNGRRRYDFPG
jgi:hypothetical protein